jgi:hypothetical protein
MPHSYWMEERISVGRPASRGSGMGVVLMICSRPYPIELKRSSSEALL